jgi:hypothetical protein
MTLRTMPQVPPRPRTVTQAEEYGYWLLMVAGVLLAAGLLMTVTLVFVFVGVPLLIIGTLVAWGDLIWMLRVARQPVRETICEVCGKPNRAFLDSGPVECEECGAFLNELPARESL